MNSVRVGDASRCCSMLLGHAPMLARELRKFSLFHQRYIDESETCDVHVTPWPANDQAGKSHLSYTRVQQTYRTGRADVELVAGSSQGKCRAHIELEWPRSWISWVEHLGPLAELCRTAIQLLHHYLAAFFGVSFCSLSPTPPLSPSLRTSEWLSL
jgi:hypothetical protein